MDNKKFLEKEVKLLSKFETARVKALKKEHKRQVEGFVEDLKLVDNDPLTWVERKWVNDKIDKKKKKWFGGKNEE